ncbi:MAG: L-serine ammonia-lyase [Gammaproteobacteria bacterium]|nr:L-serine ammonia-lyase [Gammaproteobacteria bacterium]
MFISVLDLLKVGIGPSSSHTMGPMVAAHLFLQQLRTFGLPDTSRIKCTLKGSLAFTGKGHATDQAIVLGLHGYLPANLINTDVSTLIAQLMHQSQISTPHNQTLLFDPTQDIHFDLGPALPEHPNGLIFELVDSHQQTLKKETYFSIGGGFVSTLQEIKQLHAPLHMEDNDLSPFGFNSAREMLLMSASSGQSIAQMKRQNELTRMSERKLKMGLDQIWTAMQQCINNGLNADGLLPGGLNVNRRAKHLHQQLVNAPQQCSLNEWLCAYAMAVNEENAAGHMVVTAPTNGAAGVIPAVLYYAVKHEHASNDDVHTFLLTAAAIGGIIKHNSSISGAEVGCQGEVGSAAAMAAAGLCAIKGGCSAQIENAAEIALEHHLGMTCDPVKGLVQVPCIERNGFGAIKAYTAATLALRGSGQHIMPLDACIAAMKQTGQEMSHKFKETSLGGLAVSITEC